jgi:two-component system sensor kinase FixL
VPEVEPSDLLAAILESSEDAIFSIRADGTIASWNRGAERVFGYSTAEMIDQPAALLLPSARADQSHTAPGTFDITTENGPREMALFAKGGRRLDVRVTLSPILDATGGVTGRLVIAHDVRGRVELDADLRTVQARWRAVIDSAVDGIIVIDARGTIEVFNSAAERMFGYSQQEAVGRSVNMLMPAPYRDDHDGYIRRYLDTGQQKIIGIGREVTALRRDGTTFPVHLSVGELRVGADPHFTGILHDLSARTRLEERLREESALARLGEMAAVIAHEVRNPLAAVRGAIQVVGSRLPADGKDAPVIREILSRLDGLNSLLNDLLLFGRTPAPRFAPVSLGGLLQAIADLLSTDPAFKELDFDLEADPAPIVADAELLRIVFQNLLINAGQAVAGRGTIRMRVVSDQQGRWIRIADNGPGIPPEVRGKLFKPFMTTKARGTGLGLSIAKRLVELHNGAIAIHCPAEGGTEVVVRLPENQQSEIN